MFAFILRRLAVAIPTLLLLIVFSFVLMQMAPGGPFTGERALPPAVLANLEAQYGLNDQPPPGNRPYHSVKTSTNSGAITKVGSTCAPLEMPTAR